MTRSDRPDPLDLLREAAKFLALRPSGHTGSLDDRIPWFTHGGISHGADRPDCVVCQWLALAALSTPPPSRSAEELMETLEVGPDPVYWAGYRDGTAATPPPSLDIDRLARALAITEVGCWANKPVHGPDQDTEIHRRDAEAIAREYARSDE